MAIRLTFEIGHSASRKTKPSKEGFTHDWELYVRGGDPQNDISHFVEKVVFNLHESFPKPKRVIKEPPYTVKEAGYAGFVLSIDIYLKNREEPKKLTYDYDLDLQPMKSQKEEVTIQSPTDEFRRKCLKGGGFMVSGDFKNRDSYTKTASQPPVTGEIKKSSKRPDEAKPNEVFTRLFGAPLKKPDPSANVGKPPPPSTGSKGEKTSSSSGGKDKGEKSKHKHSPSKESGKKSNESTSKPEGEKSKKDKGKDRERSDKKDKTSKRPSSPSPSSTGRSNSTNNNTIPASKTDLNKAQATSKLAAAPFSIDSFAKKSSKKEKKSDKDRERSEKKDSKSSSKDKSNFESKQRDTSKDEREKSKSKSVADPKATPTKHSEKDAERKHKHKKKEKSKDKDSSRESVKKEKQHKVPAPSPPKAKEPQPVKFEPPPSDSEAESPASIKQDTDSSSDSKPPREIEKQSKKSREKSRTSEDSSRKRKANRKDDRDSSVSPPPPKQSRSPPVQSSDTGAHQSHMNNNNNNNNNNVDGAGNDNRKISNEYMTELKDLKQKITTLKNNDDLQQVVRLIAATGCYEITKSSFDFDLVQLDRGTVQRLQDFFLASSS